MNRNYQRELDEILLKLEKTSEVPSLLLHSCCAPCSSYCLEYLSKFFRITVFYYNPNISPRNEYEMRVEEQKRLIREMDTAYPVEFMEGVYEPEKYYELVQGLEQEPERGKRCEVCFKMRLLEAAKAAKAMNAAYFTTTLSISPLKSAKLLNEIGEKIAKEEGISYLPSDFKKKNGYKKSIELSKEYNLYRQNYCGCVFSKNESKERMKSGD